VVVAAKAGHRAGVGACSSEYEPAASSRCEDDIFAAGFGDIDDTVVDLDGAAVDDAGNDDRAAGAVRYQRARIGDGAAQLERAPA
jgi:hypothetical protein